MEDDTRTLADLFQAWTAWLGLAFSVAVIAFAVLGLALSLTSFVRMFNQMRERARDEIPWGHMMGVVIAGFVSVMGLVYGLSSLLWSPA